MIVLIVLIHKTLIQIITEENKSLVGKWAKETIWKLPVRNYKWLMNKYSILLIIKYNLKKLFSSNFCINLDHIYFLKNFKQLKSTMNDIKNYF